MVKKLNNNHNNLDYKKRKYIIIFKVIFIGGIIMKEKICEKCGFVNDVNAFYCQKCGSHLSNKSIKNFVKSLKLGSVAGGGAKGVSIAPIAGMEVDKMSGSAQSFKPVRKSYSLEDGSWYCPYCGKKNKEHDMECGDCEKTKPHE